LGFDIGLAGGSISCHPRTLTVSRRVVNNVSRAESKIGNRPLYEFSVPRISVAVLVVYGMVISALGGTGTEC